MDARPRRTTIRLVRTRWFNDIPPQVRLLGVVSFFADLSSELVYPIIPLFLTVTLGAPAAAVGITEGVAEATANLTRLFSGRWSDRIGARKPFVVAGYALAAAGKAILCIAPAWGFALAGRAVDRFGKGIRSAPRDALLADYATPETRGRIFGFHRSMDSAGAVGGPLIGLAFLALAGDHLRIAIALAVIPGVLSVFALRTVKERPAPEGAESGGAPAGLRSLPRAYWLALGAVGLFMAGNSSDAFLLLRAKDIGLGATLVVLGYVLYNTIYTLGAYPAGAFSDRIPRPVLLCAGYAVFALVYFGFARASHGWTVWPLMATYGVYIAATDGVTKALISDLSPGELRSSALGVFQGVTGMTALFASVAAGILWDEIDPSAPFYLGAACAMAAAALLAGLTASGALGVRQSAAA